MKKLFPLLFFLLAFNLYGQEFDGEYKVTYFTAESDGVAPMSNLVKWAAVVKGDTIKIYDSKKMSNSISTLILGSSSKGDVRFRTTINKLDEKGGYSINVSTVDDFTKRVSTVVYLLAKQ